MTLKTIGVVTIALLIAPQMMSVAAQEPNVPYLIYGYGKTTCSSWTEKVTEMARTGIDLSGLRLARSGWVMGFVSGAGWVAAVSPGHPFRQTDSVALEKWIDTYCQLNPMDDIAGASQKLVADLLEP